MFFPVIDLLLILVPAAVVAVVAGLVAVANLTACSLAPRKVKARGRQLCSPGAWSLADWQLLTSTLPCLDNLRVCCAVASIRSCRDMLRLDVGEALPQDWRGPVDGRCVPLFLGHACAGCLWLSHDALGPKECVRRQGYLQDNLLGGGDWYDRSGGSGAIPSTVSEPV